MSDPLGGLGDVGDFEEPPERLDPYSRVFEEIKYGRSHRYPYYMSIYQYCENIISEMRL